MRLLLAAFLLSLLTFSCTADGVFDADAAYDLADRLREELPTKEEFRRMAEKHIADLPTDEQAKARAELDKVIAEWPTKEEIDRSVTAVIDDIAREAPDRATIEDAINVAIDELPTKEQLKEAIDGLPEKEELKESLGNGLAGFVAIMDSLATELKEEK